MLNLKDRSWHEDLTTLLCAENLVVADSTLSFLLLAHARAKRFFLPTVCGPPAQQYRGINTQEMPQKVLDRDPFNSALLCAENSGVEVRSVALFSNSLLIY